MLVSDEKYRIAISERLSDAMRRNGHSANKWLAVADVAIDACGVVEQGAKLDEASRLIAAAMQAGAFVDEEITKAALFLDGQPPPPPAPHPDAAEVVALRTELKEAREVITRSANRHTAEVASLKLQLKDALDLIARTRQLLAAH